MDKVLDRVENALLSTAGALEGLERSVNEIADKLDDIEEESATLRSVMATFLGQGRCAGCGDKMKDVGRRHKVGSLDSVNYCTDGEFRCLICANEWQARGME